MCESKEYIIFSEKIVFLMRSSSITTEYAVSSEKVHILQSIKQQYRVDDGIKAKFDARHFLRGKNQQQI